MVKTRRVFISHTSEFTKYPERKSFIDAAIAAVNRAGSVPCDMGYFTARDEKPAEYCKKCVRECDVYVGVIGLRYGSPVRDRPEVSYTELEFEAATEASAIKRFIFLLDPESSVPLGRFMDVKYGDRQERFRTRLNDASVTCMPFSDAHQLETLIYQALKEDEEQRSESSPRQIRIVWPEGKSPYRGLQWFNQEYAPLFFGRNREVDELVAKMSDPGGRALLVVGASGSGKSSVVAVGVWQAVIKEGRLPGSAQWVWQRIQPSDGDTPCDALARGLKETFQLSARPRFTTNGLTLPNLLSQHLSQGQELIVFLDQLEELFTSSFKELDIQTFLGQLIDTAQDLTNRLRVVATIRSEFLGKLEGYESTLALLNSPYRYHLGPVSPRILQEMIQKPADETGYGFESGLIDRIVDDTGQEPGNLPLVAYALKQLFDNREGKTFTLEAYDAIGGVVGAIATKANEMLAELPDEVRGAFDAVFAELVHVERERPPTRRRAAFSIFNSNPNALRLIEALAGRNCRVLVTIESKQKTFVEVAHEKLFTAWPSLRSWIGKSGDALRLIEHATEAAYRWWERGKKIDELWSPTRAKEVLAALEKLCKRPLPVLERFLKPQDLLIEHFSQYPLSHRRRAHIGTILNEFGDSRPGVGIGEHGLPDIAWVEIPHGEIRLRGVDHVFEVKPIRLAKYLVTNVQFQLFIDDRGYEELEWWGGLDKIAPLEPAWKEYNCPRENVSWHEAIAFCRWLSARTKTSIRLPTEWEWQQAATGGGSAREFPWLGHWDPTCCNSPQSGLSRTTAVGLYPSGATQQGVLDMAGNVWEWCLNTYEKPETLETTTIVELGAEHVIRGGSWFHLPGSLRPSNRYRYNARYRTNFIGFRLAQDIER